MCDLCKGVHCVDLGESFQTLFKRIFTCKIWLRYSRERALQSLSDPVTADDQSWTRGSQRTGRFPVLTVIQDPVSPLHDCRRRPLAAGVAVGDAGLPGGVRDGAILRCFLSIILTFG